MSSSLEDDGKLVKLETGQGMTPWKSVCYFFRASAAHEDLQVFESQLASFGLTFNNQKLTASVLASKAIVLNSAGKPDIVLGMGDWFHQLIEGQSYTINLEPHSVNPFVQKEDAMCCGFNFVDHMKTIETMFDFLDVAEEEDKTTQKYRAMAMYLLAGGKRRRNDDGTEEEIRLPRLLQEGGDDYAKANEETSRVLPFEDSAAEKVAMQFLLLPETDDWYEVEHRNFMKNRIRIEMKDTAKYCVWLFYLSILEFCLGCVIFGVGSVQLGGGSDAVVIASFTSGGVMVLSSCLGFVGSLSAHKDYIQRFMVSALLTMSFLTTYLYVEIAFLSESELEFSSKDLAAGTAVEGAKERRAEIILSLIFAAIALVITFVSTFACTQALDSINSRDTIRDDALVFRYFQVRFTELKRQVEHIAAASSGTYASITRTDASTAVRAGTDALRQ
ncbi:hypothetical protein DIPPA_18429 [Diplonema papillatum]|nr:hypothetical protein DIPPA_18429 [Diplonema papillatum]